MTGRATFGDFASAASKHLARAMSLADPVASGRAAPLRLMDASELRHGMGRVVAVLSRYIADITASYLPVSQYQRPVLAEWPRAATEAAEALTLAAAVLAPDSQPASASCRRRSASAAGRELDAAFTFMTAGRDLLQSHLWIEPDGTRGHRTEWATVITSVPVTGAVMAELAQWAGMIASCGERVTEAQMRRARKIPAAREALLAQRRLAAASQSLLKMHWAVQRAQEREPVSSADVRLLHAIPANVLPVRRRPGDLEQAAELCQGTSDSAERIRYTARAVAPDASWSPYLTGASLRETAASATAVSHHCSIVLRIASASAFGCGAASVSAGLLESAAAAEQARDAWLATARMWELVTTDTRGVTSPVTAEAADLALWTGRLAYADRAWSLAKGPVQAWRSAESLCPKFRDLPGVVAAVHQACDALTQLAAADYQQIRHAAQAGRLYSPTRTLPDTFDIPHPFSRTPRNRVWLLLDTYRNACETSAQTTAEIAAVAETVRAPSIILTAARAAARANSAGLLMDEVVVDARRGGSRLVEFGTSEPPGHFERILSQLGETDPVMLKRAATIDLAGEQLMIESARVAEPRHEVIRASHGQEYRRRDEAVAAPDSTRELEAEI